MNEEGAWAEAWDRTTQQGYLSGMGMEWDMSLGKGRGGGRSTGKDSLTGAWVGQ